ncbi:hypothetical protein N7453_005561 [Penicillium expansum]|nr:hypothetical protein N7453_005561 [Penicillium expansum]
MDIVSIVSAALRLISLLGELMMFANDYRLLIVTKELAYLLSQAQGRQTLLTSTSNAFENVLRHVAFSPQHEGGYKALCEQLQRRFVEFRQTAKTINNEIQSVCGQKGPKISKGRHLLPHGVGATAIPFAKNKPFTIPRLASDFHRGHNDHLEDLLKILNPPSAQGLKTRGKDWAVFRIDANSNQITKVYIDNDRFESPDPTMFVTDGADWLSKAQETEFLNIGNAQDFAKCLSNVEEPWTLIIENASDLTKAKEYFPSGDKGHILFTAPSPDQTVESIHISEMNHEHKRGFLLWEAGFVEPWCASDIAWSKDVIFKLGSNIGLLTLSHVGATIRNGFCVAEEYPALLEKQQKMVLKPDLSMLAFEVAVAQIRQQKTRSSKDALKLLKLFPFFNSEYIALDTLTKAIVIRKTFTGRDEGATTRIPAILTYGEVKSFNSNCIGKKGKALNTPQFASDFQSPAFLDPSRAYWALTELVNMSLVIYHPSNDTYSMDGVVKGWIEDNLHPSDHEDWRNLARMAASHQVVEPEGVEKSLSVPAS